MNYSQVSSSISWIFRIYWTDKESSWFFHWKVSFIYVLNAHVLKSGSFVCLFFFSLEFLNFLLSSWNNRGNMLENGFFFLFYISRWSIRPWAAQHGISLLFSKSPASWMLAGFDTSCLLPLAINLPVNKTWH
jgi:hypothetical protein